MTPIANRPARRIARRIAAPAARSLSTLLPHFSAAQPIFLALLLALPTLLSAQYLTEGYGAFMQGFDVSAHQGQRFKVTTAVRAECLTPASGAEVWVRIDKLDKKTGFFYNMMDKPIRDTQWKVYTIAGKIDKGAQKLVFGGLYQNKGNYYFDDFHLLIETANNHWEEMPINDGNLEGDTTIFNKSWFFRHDWNFFSPRVTFEHPYEGKQAIKVDATQYVAVRQTGYGNNDSAGRFVKANGINIYVETYGQGEPLLLLHGNSSNIYSFRLQIPELSKHYRVIAVDSRGQGRSTEDGKTYTYDLFAEDMNALLDTLHLDSVNVLGWSDGGNTGLIMAMNYPRKVKKLAAMGANVFIDGTVVDKWVFDTLRAQQRDLEGDSTWPGRNRSRLITLLLTEPRHHFEELSAIHCPVLVMAGDHDVIRGPHTRQIARHIAGSTLVIFKKGTHEEPWEHPDRFNKTVLDYLARPSP